MSFWVKVFTGTVEECNRSSQTDVSGDISGGGGEIDGRHGGLIGEVVGSVTSDTTTTLELYIKDPEKERHFSFRNISFPVRRGHRVSVVWAGREGEGSGRYILLHNHSLERSTWLEAFSQLADPGIAVPDETPAFTQDHIQSVRSTWTVLLWCAGLLGWIPGLVIATHLSDQACGHDWCESVAPGKWLMLPWIVALGLGLFARFFGIDAAEARVRKSRAEVDARRTEIFERIKAERARREADLRARVRASLERAATV